jgi:hypothetical protein
VYNQLRNDLKSSLDDKKPTLLPQVDNLRVLKERMTNNKLNADRAITSGRVEADRKQIEVGVTPEMMIKDYSVDPVVQYLGNDDVYSRSKYFGRSNQKGDASIALAN